MSRLVKITILAALTLLFATTTGTCFAASTIPNVADDMLNAEYWITKLN